MSGGKRPTTGLAAIEVLACQRPLAKGLGVLMAQGMLKHSMAGVVGAASVNDSLAGICGAGPYDPLSVDRQVRLSPGHHVMPYSISRASNGDFIVFGANNEMEY
jgi:hypothetical protein